MQLEGQRTNRKGDIMNVTKMISKYNYYSGTIDRLKDGYIVIHYTGALGSAKQQCEYFAGGDRGASAHYFVDHNGDVYQSVEDQNSAWHCGSKTGYKHPVCRNTNSIGIELCCKTTGDKNVADANWYFEDATVASAIALTKELMAKYNIPADHVLRHHDVTGKACPAPYVFNKGKHTWDQFQKAIQSSSEDSPSDSLLSELKETVPFLVQVTIPDLNIRKGPGTNYEKSGKYTGVGVFTIIKVSEGKGSNSGWGLLKSYPQEDGWISLDYAKKVGRP